MKKFSFLFLIAFIGSSVAEVDLQRSRELQYGFKRYGGGTWMKMYNNHNKWMQMANNNHYMMPMYGNTKWMQMAHNQQQKWKPNMMYSHLNAGNGFKGRYMNNMQGGNMMFYKEMGMGNRSGKGKGKGKGKGGTPNPPSEAPTSMPSGPTTPPTNLPTRSPTVSPTFGPTSAPTTAAPTNAPTNNPTRVPTTVAPTRVPTTSAPTSAPTSSPTSTPTSSPTAMPVAPILIREDPCAAFDAPGEYEVGGGPDMVLPQNYQFQLVDVGDAFGYASEFISPVTNNDGDGIWYVEKTSGQAGVVSGVIPTDDLGDFDIVFPVFCGEQRFTVSWGTYCIVHTIQNTNCIEEDISVTLSWGEDAFDLELHLIQDGGQINNFDGGEADCTWSNPDPDWGVQGDPDDDPLKLLDVAEDNGIENIGLSNAEDIIYHVMVEYWDIGVPADPEVVLNVGGETTVASISDFNPQEVWYVGTINWTTGTVTVLNQIIDCLDAWDEFDGCTLDIP